MRKTFLAPFFLSLVYRNLCVWISKRENCTKDVFRNKKKDSWMWAAQFPSTVEGRSVDFYDILLVFFVWITLGLQFYAFCECSLCVCEWRQFSFFHPLTLLFRLFEGYFSPTTHSIEVRSNKFILRPISGCCFFGVYFLAS